MRSAQKYLTQYLDAFTIPSTDAWTGVEITRKSAPRLPKITTKQLVSIRTNAPYSPYRSGSERALFHTNKHEILHSFVIKKKTRSNSTNGLCYYNKGPKITKI